MFVANPDCDGPSIRTSLPTRFRLRHYTENDYFCILLLLFLDFILNTLPTVFGGDIFISFNFL